MQFNDCMTFFFTDIDNDETGIQQKLLTHMKLHTRSMTVDLWPRSQKRLLWESQWLKFHFSSAKPLTCANFPKSITEESIQPCRCEIFLLLVTTRDSKVCCSLSAHLCPAASSVHLLSLPPKFWPFLLVISATVAGRSKLQILKRKGLLGGLWRDQDVGLTASLIIVTLHRTTLSLSVSVFPVTLTVVRIVTGKIQSLISTNHFECARLPVSLAAWYCQLIFLIILYIMYCHNFKHRCSTNFALLQV